ncbi:hypothetical protein D3C86_1637970 [compost metagenome]
MRALAQAREAREHRFHAAHHLHARQRAGGEGAQAEVVEHGQLREHLPAFRHEYHAHRGDACGVQPGEIGPVERDAALHRAMQARQRAHQRGLAGAVGAQ